MWLGYVWVSLLGLHVVLLGVGLLQRESFVLFDRLVYYSCFLMYGVMDSYQMNLRTILAFVIQFGFWSIMGIAARYFYLQIRKSLRTL